MNCPLVYRTYYGVRTTDKLFLKNEPRPGPEGTLKPVSRYLNLCLSLRDAGSGLRPGVWFPSVQETFAHWFSVILILKTLFLFFPVHLLPNLKRLKVVSFWVPKIFLRRKPPFSSSWETQSPSPPMHLKDDSVTQKKI